MVNWKILKAAIPDRITLGKASYEILWVDSFKQENTLGETRWNPKQIVIKKNLSPKETVMTYLHETFHAASFESEANLTENQVIACEKMVYFYLKSGNIFKSKKRKPKKDEK